MQHLSSTAPLQALGWSALWQASFDSFLSALGSHTLSLEPGRVLAGSRDALRVGTARGEEEALVPGRLLYRAESPAELPCVGDWLALRRLDEAAGEQPLLVEAVLPRKSVFVRRAAGRRSEPQALAANVDLALLVAGLDEPWKPRRLERWLALTREAGVPAVVVLTKLDLCVEDDAAAVIAAASALAAPAPVHAVDALGGAGVERLRPHLRAGETVVLLGISGAGKSTLANQLAGRPLAATGALADDGRGRHTTTRRELLPLPGGALLLDTPGLREVGLWLGDDDLAGTFPEIDALAQSCRFRDCTHESEPDCAVREAVAAGSLDADRLASFRQLTAEREALRRRTDEGAARRAKQQVKALHRAANKHKPRQL
ncbi:MAG TPA: ribosome small subunit-dependent GTPase A [Thermoanaerobaculia bacterium]|nr:ribosome small subunit-dependent GTPase A [Thermoanaerobaculia bacterium]HXT50310.1 ribosome small subunit-dependent GTPase A [Thermoanaerobaculia bacterium]